MHPVAYSAEYQGEDRSRLSVFFRLFIAIPWFIVAFFYGIGAWVATIIAWFAIVFTGNYPQGLYDFNAGFIRFATRINAFFYLLTDEFPSFNGDDEPDYPIRTLIEPPKAEYSRLKTFFRIILLIPVSILSYVMSLILGIVGFVAWLVIVFTGKLPEGLYKPMRIASAYMTKALAYYLLLTEDFPPFWMDEEEEAPRFLGDGDGARSPGLTAETTGPAGL
ncbi:MAG: DUF4389 domain-containing protein [Actinomycetota bacterium]|nr:DUF4389 domain-containing protein [Actinomycetota bacterium]